MSDEAKYNVDFAEIKFIELVHDGKFSELFKVEALGRVCLFKVYRTYNWDDGTGDYEWNLLKWESDAYRRLHESLICKKGIVPDFYGTVTNIEPQACTELRTFRKGPRPPKGILIEYILDLERIHLGNYTEARIRKLVDIMAEIHAVRVLHRDWHARNMAIARQGDEERILWIDFDRAQTLPLDRSLTETETKSFWVELELVKSFIVPPPPEDVDALRTWTGEMTLPCKEIICRLV